MHPRQTVPRRWLIVKADEAADAMECARRLEPGSGVLLLGTLTAAQLRPLARLARRRQLLLLSEGRRSGRRVHDSRELGKALLHRTPFVFLSPIHPTASHPEWSAIPRMRAAALARLSRRRLFALGGMNDRRYAKVAQLGFVGWAGISAFRS